MTAPCPYAVHFGGPAQPPRRLSLLLAECTDAVPAGGEIHWVTYYFRDRALAEALLRARRRGVKVWLTVEESPRTGHANQEMLRLLGGPEGLGTGLRSLAHQPFFKRGWLPHLHEKLYCFSHPQPCALVGSFNPSGCDVETEPEILAAIGDHDRGYNFLVELREPSIVAGLVEHARRMHEARHGRFERFGIAANAALRSEDLTIHFWPRWLPNPILRALSKEPRGSVVRIAASHLKGRTAARALVRLVRRAGRITVLCEATHRRVPPSAIRGLRDAGIDVRRIVHPDRLPMHDKFLLVERVDGTRWVAFGSLNWTEGSFRRNHEIAAVCTHPKLFEAFDERWRSIEAQAKSGDDLGAELGPERTS